MSLDVVECSPGHAPLNATGIDTRTERTRGIEEVAKLLGEASCISISGHPRIGAIRYRNHASRSSDRALTSKEKSRPKQTKAWLVLALTTEDSHGDIEEQPMELAERLTILGCSIVLFVVIGLITFKRGLAHEFVQVHWH
jgi:hypothetical protein